MCFKGFWFEQQKGFHGFFGFWNRTFIGFDRIPWDLCPPKLCFRPTETNLFFGHAVCVMHHNPTSYLIRGAHLWVIVPYVDHLRMHESVVSRFESWKGKEDVPWEHHGTTSSGWWFGTWIIMVNLWYIMANNWNNNISGWWWLEPWNLIRLSIKSWEFHHPNCYSLTPSFFRGVGGSTTNQSWC